MNWPGAEPVLAVHKILCTLSKPNTAKQFGAGGGGNRPPGGG